MEEQYFYSSSVNGFFFYSLKPIYDNSESGWPTDAISISERWYKYLLNGQSKGRCIVSNEYGQPILSEPPPPTAAEAIAMVESQKNGLMLAANNIIAPLQDAVEFGDATDEEKALLLSWRQYRVSLMRIDTGSAPDVCWPEPPTI